MKKKLEMNNKTKMVGAYMPLPISDYIDLYAYVTKQTKSKVLRKLLEDFAEPELIPKFEKLIVQEIQYDWFRHCEINHKDACKNTVLKHFHIYIEKQRTHLKYLLPEKSLSRILEQVKA